MKQATKVEQGHGKALQVLRRWTQRKGWQGKGMTSAWRAFGIKVASCKCNNTSHNTTKNGSNANHHKFNCIKVLCTIIILYWLEPRSGVWDGWTVLYSSLLWTRLFWFVESPSHYVILASFDWRSPPTGTAAGSSRKAASDLRKIQVRDPLTYRRLHVISKKKHEEALQSKLRAYSSL